MQRLSKTISLSSRFACAATTSASSCAVRLAARNRPTSAVLAPQTISGNRSYHAKVIEHYERPQNVRRSSDGVFEDFTNIPDFTSVLLVVCLLFCDSMRTLSSAYLIDVLIAITHLPAPTTSSQSGWINAEGRRRCWHRPGRRPCVRCLRQHLRCG